MPEREIMLCEVLSEFSQPALPLPCNVCISVMSEHRHGDGVTQSQLPDLTSPRTSAPHLITRTLRFPTFTAPRAPHFTRAVRVSLRVWIRLRDGVHAVWCKNRGDP